MEIIFHRKRSKEKKKRSKVKRKETLKSVAEEDSAILDYKEIPIVSTNRSRQLLDRMYRS